MPRATSRAIEPLAMISTGVRVSSPRRMTEPLPNCRSICMSAASSALFLSLARSGEAVLLGGMGTPCCQWLCQAGRDTRRPALDVLRPLPTPHTLRATTDISGPDRPVSGKRVVNMQCPNIHHYRGTTVRAWQGHAGLFDQFARRPEETPRDAARAAPRRRLSADGAGSGPP